MSKVRSLLLLLFIPSFTLICSFVALFIYAPFCSQKACDNFIKFWAEVLLTLSGVELEVRGRDNLKGISSAIFVSNHMSLFDIPVLYVALPFSFRMAAKAELFKIPLFGKSLTAFGFFPLARNSPANTAMTLKSMAKRFSQGGSVWMAPEGTRQVQPKIGNFKPGAFFLALKTQQTLVPIVIYGTHNVLPKNSLLVSWKWWRQKVLVDIGEPISLESAPFEDHGKLKEHVRTQMQSTLTRLIFP